MTEELKKYLQQTLIATEGLLSIIISDKDGVAICKVADEKVPELASKPHFLSAFAVVSQQAAKLRLGKSKRFTCTYSNYQVVHVNNPPVVVTFIADVNSNIGYLYNLYDELRPLLEDIKGIAYEKVK